MAKFDLRSWAVKGAEQRLAEIAAEARGIFTAFPELRGSGRGFEAAAVGSYGGTAPQQRSKRKGRKRSAEARRRMSEAQKARWAKQRAAKRK